MVGTLTAKSTTELKHCPSLVPRLSGLTQGGGERKIVPYQKPGHEASTVRAQEGECKHWTVSSSTGRSVRALDGQPKRWTVSTSTGQSVRALDGQPEHQMVNSNTEQALDMKLTHGRLEWLTKPVAKACAV